MRSDRLVQMANDISDFFAAEASPDAAAADFANHLKKFWSRSMRCELASYVEKAGGEGLSPIARLGVERHHDTLCGDGDAPVLSDPRWVGPPGSSDAG